DAAVADRGEGAVGGRAVRYHAVPRPLSTPALRRGAATRGPVPGAGPGPEGVPPRRAPREPRRQAPQHRPRRAETVSAPDPAHHGVRDARPGGSDGAG